MGTELRAHVWAADSAAANRSLVAAHDEVVLVDNLMSPLQENSEVSVANRRAGKDSITYISPSLTSLIAAVIKYSQATGGALDVTAGPLVNVWGFHDHKGRVPTPAQLDSARRLMGLKRIVFNEPERTIKLTLRGMQLDPGTLAAGFALDRAARAMRGAGAQAGVLELSGNTLHFGALPEAQRSVRIRDPRDSQKELGSLQADSGVVSTAGNGDEFFEQDGVRYGRIFDPRSGQPVQGTASVTVVAPTGLDAAALSTALFVLGPGKGCAVAGREHVEAIWVTPVSGGSNALRLTVTPRIAEQLQLVDSTARVRCPA
jgi:thiamine biosynthesis lipoprotein